MRQSLRSGATFIGLHLQAALWTLVLFLIGLIGLWTLTYIGLLVAAAATGKDMGGPLAYPAGVVLLAIVGVLSAFLVTVLGVALDLVRRALCWPIWTPPCVVVPASFLLALGVGLSQGVVPWKALLLALIAGALLFGALLIYWVPLMLIGPAWRLVARVARFLHAWLMRVFLRHAEKHRVTPLADS